MFTKHIKVNGKHMRGTIIGRLFYTSKTLKAEESYTTIQIQQVIEELEAIKKEMESSNNEN